MALGPDEQIPNDADNTFVRRRVIEKWFTQPEDEDELEDQDEDE